jgi:hypothetical protein
MSARALIARALVMAGDLVSGTREASINLADGAAFPTVQSSTLAALTLAELRRGRPAEALELSIKGLDGESRTPWPTLGSLLRLLHAEALHDLGHTEAARVAIREARDRVLRISATLDDEPMLRESYLADIDANARTLKRASEWLE